MEDRLLTSHPLAVSIGNRGVGRQHAGHIPVEQIRVVSKSLGVIGMVVQDNRPVVAETATNTTDNEVHDPNVCETSANVEVLDGQFTNGHKTEKATKLSTRSVVRIVEVGTIYGARYLTHLALGEPAGNNSEVLLGTGSPCRHALLKVVFGQTETDELVVGDVIRGLGVNLTTLKIIISVLVFLAAFPIAAVVLAGLCSRIKRNLGGCFTHLINI